MFFQQLVAALLATMARPSQKYCITKHGRAIYGRAMCCDMSAIVLRMMQTPKRATQTGNNG